MQVSDTTPRGQHNGSGALPRALVSGSAVLYRLYDVGYEIDLERTITLLAPGGAARARPGSGEAAALQISNPPVTVALGHEPIVVGEREFDGTVSARVFDFGALSLRLHVPSATGISWQSYVAFGNALDDRADLASLLDRHLASLIDRIGSAIERPAVSPVVEDYLVFRISGAALPDGSRLDAAAFRDEDLIPLLIGERRPLSASARRELMPHRFSYYDDDLAVLTWNNALVMEPSIDDDGETDVQYILEFANAQLLELRVYDAILDAEVPKLSDRIARARRRFALIRRRYAEVLSALQTLVADSTELVERVENALKVTDDVYLARVYSAALEIFRGRAWRSGIDRKLTIMRETYSMLNAESQARRAEALEIAIVGLIIAELALAFTKH